MGEDNTKRDDWKGEHLRVQAEIWCKGNFQKSKGMTPA